MRRRRPRAGPVARAARRWPTPCSRRPSSTSPEPTYPLDLAFCPAARWCRSPRPCRPRSCSATTSTSRRSPTRCCATPRELARELVVERAARAATAWWSRPPATTATCCSIYQRAGVRVLGIEPARNIAAVARGATASRPVAEFFDRELAQRLAARGHARRRLPRPQRAGPRRRPERFRRRHSQPCSKDDGVAVDRGALRQGHARPLRVRHDLPRAPLLLLADRARRTLPPARPGDRRRRARADPRRLAAPPRRPEGADDRRPRPVTRAARGGAAWGVDELATVPRRSPTASSELERELVATARATPLRRRPAIAAYGRRPRAARS